MNTARVAWLEKQKEENTKEQDTCPDLTQGSFVNILKWRCEQEATKDAAYRDIMREYYKDKPFPDKSGEWEDI